MVRFFDIVVSFFMDFGEFIVNNIKSIGVRDIIDMIIVSFLIYWVLKFFKNTRTVQLLRGIVFLVIILVGAQIFSIEATRFLLDNTLGMGFIAIMILFQPELRKVIERVGTSGTVSKIFNQEDESYTKKIKESISQITKSVFKLSSKKVGALIVFERDITLQEVCETGFILNSDVSSKLIENIFFPLAPLHDGAIVIRGGDLYAASCLLPLSQNKDASLDLGTRHRAAIGISESSDSIVVVVSEETSIVSIAVSGELERNYTMPKLVERLEELLLPEEKTEKKDFKKIFKKTKNTDENQ